MHNPPTTWCSRALLALILAGSAASAEASTIYDFAFFDYATHEELAAGSFATGNSSAVDAGYNLVTAMTLDWILGDISGLPYVGPFIATSFQTDAAYNPSTGAFINHQAGQTFQLLGSVHLAAADGTFVTLTSSAFPNQPNFIFSASINGTAQGDHISRIATLQLTPAAIPTVPEPASLVLLGTGLLGAVISRRRTRIT